MTLDEFCDLCKGEWNDCRGEIVTLWLTEESYRELQQEGVTQEQGVLYTENGATRAATREIYHYGSPVAQQVEMSLSTVRNPVTKNPVRMKLASDKDAADCFSAEAKQMYTKVLKA